MTDKKKPEAESQQSGESEAPQGMDLVPREKHYDRFRTALVARRDEIEKALAGRMNPDHFIEVATTAYLENPDLHDADPISIYRALRRAAQMKLRPDGQEGFIGTYKTKMKFQGGGERWVKMAQFQPMYQGLIRTLKRGGSVLKVDAEVVRTGDAFDYQFGDDPFIRHKPNPDPTKRGDVEFAYAVFWLRGGLKQREVMSRLEMDQIREQNRKRNNGREGPAWQQEPSQSQMYRKMPIKRGAKFLDLDPEQAAVFRYDDAVDVGKDREPADDIPEAEWRTVEERAQDAAKREVDDLRAGMSRMQARTIADEPVGFGKHRDLTWGELHEKLPGYITHYVLKDDECPWVEDSVKAALRAWLGINGDEDKPPESEPDPKHMEELHQRGSEALVKLRKAKKISDEQLASFGADLGMAHDEKREFELADMVDEFERQVAADKAEKTGDLFGGAAQQDES